MACIKLSIGRTSEDIPDNLWDEIYDQSVNGIEVLAKDDDFPMPWDAGMYLENNMLVLEGAAGPSGFGSAVTKIPIDSVNRILDIQICADDDESLEILSDIFREYGWL